MNRLKRPSQARVASGINSVLGAWLMLSPWMFGHDPDDVRILWAEVVSGTVIGTLGMARSLWPRDGIVLSWTNMFLGGWTALLPWTLTFIDNPSAAWNCVTVGITIVFFAGWSIMATNFDRAQRHP